MAELAVTDVTAAAAWYARTLGMRAILEDPATGFVLLEDAAGGKLALKPGTPTPGGLTLHFRVDCVDAELARLGVTAEVKASPEGYRRAMLTDPDGYRVCLFAWATAGAPSTPR